MPARMGGEVENARKFCYNIVIQRNFIFLEHTMTEDERVLQCFGFLIERGFTFERDYSKGTDSTCTQIYRFKKDAYNFLEYRVLSQRERALVAVVKGEKKFPSLEKRNSAFVRAWKLKHLFSPTDAWEFAAALLKEEIRRTGNVLGIEK